MCVRQSSCYMYRYTTVAVPSNPSVEDPQFGIEVVEPIGAIGTIQYDQ